MGDEPYAALLPWAVFAVVDRAQTDGALWAGLSALMTAIALLLTSSRGETGPRNVMVLGATGWFATPFLDDVADSESERRSWRFATR